MKIERAFVLYDKRHGLLFGKDQWTPDLNKAFLFQSEEEIKSLTNNLITTYPNRFIIQYIEAQWIIKKQIPL